MMSGSSTPTSGTSCWRARCARKGGGGRVVGYMSYGPTPLTEGAYDLYWMAVASGEQGRGFGRKLVSWLEKTVRGASGRMILIATSSQTKDEKTRRFYTGLAY